MDEKRQEIINRFKNSSEEEGSDLILEKRITPSEKERHWIHANSITRRLPETNEKFRLRSRDEKEKIVEVYLDKYDRIRVGSRGFWKLEMKAREAKKFKLYRTKKDGLFEIKVIKESQTE